MVSINTLLTGSVSALAAFGDAETREVLGKKLHGEACTAGPDEDPAVLIEQPCLPRRRQHFGKPASRSGAKAVAGIKETLNRASNAAAIVRRTTEWYIAYSRTVKTRDSLPF